MVRPVAEETVEESKELLPNPRLRGVKTEPGIIAA